MRVLVACEQSGIVRDAFRARGHTAYSCDIEPCERGPSWHIQRDVLEVLDDGWDMMIAHPPCTRLCNSGVRWLAERNLWAEMKAACEFFLRLLNANIRMVAVENPIPHRYAVAEIGRYSQIIQPWQHGHGETKATCLWLRNLPLLKPSNIVEGRHGRIWRLPPSKTRSIERSRTYPGIASAMADQWGAL